MAEVQEVVPGLYRVALGVVNAYLLVDDAVTVIDTGTPGSEDKILSAVRALGKTPSDVDAIIVTHCHTPAHERRVGGMHPRLCSGYPLKGG